MERRRTSGARYLKKKTPVKLNGFFTAGADSTIHSSQRLKTWEKFTEAVRKGGYFLLFVFCVFFAGKAKGGNEPPILSDFSSEEATKSAGDQRFLRSVSLLVSVRKGLFFFFSA